VKKQRVRSYLREGLTRTCRYSTAPAPPPPSLRPTTTAVAAQPLPTLPLVATAKTRASTSATSPQAATPSRSPCPITIHRRELRLWRSRRRLHRPAGRLLRLRHRRGPHLQLRLRRHRRRIDRLLASTILRARTILHRSARHRCNVRRRTSAPTIQFQSALSQPVPTAVLFQVRGVDRHVFSADRQRLSAYCRRCSYCTTVVTLSCLYRRSGRHTIRTCEDEKFPPPRGDRPQRE
jgi:hypothetical protein